MERLGIDCYFVSGTTSQVPGEEIPHAWNVAKLDGVYTNVDVTWNDLDFENAALGQLGPIIVAHEFFGLSASELSRTHTITDMQYNIPAAEPNSWYKYNGLEGATIEEVLEAAAIMLCESVYEGKGYFEVSITDAEIRAKFTESFDGGVDTIIERANEIRNAVGDPDFEGSASFYNLNEDIFALLIVVSVKEAGTEV